MLDTWLDEDLGRGDLTQSGINSSKIVNAHWECKQKGIFCGGELVKSLYSHLDPSVTILLKKADGESFTDGERIIAVSYTHLTLPTNREV